MKLHKGDWIALQADDDSGSVSMLDSKLLSRRTLKAIRCAIIRRDKALHGNEPLPCDGPYPTWAGPCYILRVVEVVTPTPVYKGRKLVKMELRKAKEHKI